MKLSFATLLVLGLAASIQAGYIGNIVSSVTGHVKEDVQLIQSQLQENMKTLQAHVQENVKAIMSGDITGAVKTITKNSVTLGQTMANQAVQNSMKFAKDYADTLKKVVPSFGNNPTAAPQEATTAAQ